MQTQLSNGRQIDASFNPEEGDQTPAAVFRYSAIGPRARTGRKERAPMSKTVPSTRIPNVRYRGDTDRGDTVRKLLTGCDLCVK